MEIKHTDGTITDTNKLPDVSAMILEKAEELRVMCETSKRQCVILVDAKGIENGCCIHFWNYMISGDIKEEKIKQKASLTMLNMIDGFLDKMYGGLYIICCRPNYNSLNNEKDEIPPSTIF